MINPVLNIAQLKSVICLIFQGKALRIDRILKNTGIHGKSCWVSYWNKDKRWSTFISKLDLQKAFWRWLCTVRILDLNQKDRLHVSWAIYTILRSGDVVFKTKLPNMGQVIDKRLNPDTKHPEILVDWGINEPCWETAVWLEAI